MNNQTLIVYQLPTLHEILKELDLDFNIIEIENKQSLQSTIKILKNYLVITPKSISNLPTIKILKLIELINIQFMKSHFNDQSKIEIKKYIINLNSRELLYDNLKLKLTEKEVNTILYLSKKNNPVKINELEKNVWQYQSNIETHTVETHIYRLRKKISQKFKDDNFIVSKKDGYQIV
jgi:hypothetical protein